MGLRSSWRELRARRTWNEEFDHAANREIDMFVPDREEGLPQRPLLVEEYGEGFTFDVNGEEVSVEEIDELCGDLTMPFDVKPPRSP